MAEQARQHGQLAGSARLVLVQGPALLHPERTVFDAMLAGWQAQQRSRLLADTTVLWRERIVRRFAEFTNAFPWSWTASDVEDWTSSLLSRNGHAHATIRSYQGAVACFLDYVVDARYGWAASARRGSGRIRCRSATSGTPPRTSPTTRAARAGGRSPARSCRRSSITPTTRWARSGRLAARAGWRRYRDATLFKVVYAWGLFSRVQSPCGSVVL